MDFSRRLKIAPFVLASAMPLMFLVVMLIVTRGFQDLEELRELESTWPILVGVMLGLGIPSLLLAVETVTTAHRLSHDGIHKHSPWSRDFFLGWEEVGSIKYSFALRRFVISSHKGKIRLDILLNGLQDFAQFVLTRVEREAWVKAAAQIYHYWSLGRDVELDLERREGMGITSWKTTGSIREVIFRPELSALLLRPYEPLRLANGHHVWDLLLVGINLDVVRELFAASGPRYRQPVPVGVWQLSGGHMERARAGNLPPSEKYLGRGEIELLASV